MNRRDEPVPATWDRYDVILAWGMRPKGATKIRDVHFQIAVVDERGRPSRFYQSFLRNKVARAFDKHGKDREGPAADAHRSAGVNKNLSVSQQFKRAEPKV